MERGRTTKIEKPRLRHLILGKYSELRNKKRKNYQEYIKVEKEQ